MPALPENPKPRTKEAANAGGGARGRKTDGSPFERAENIPADGGVRGKRRGAAARLAMASLPSGKGGAGSRQGEAVNKTPLETPARGGAKQNIKKQSTRVGTSISLVLSS